MFTGFATENTPAIQVWNFQYSSASGSAPVHVSLPDDCSPIQFFKTGGSTTAVRVYLPPCPVEGLQIKIVNARYGTSNQSLNLYASDLSYPFAPQTGNTLYVLGAGQILELCYSKDFINYQSGASGIYGSGWVSLNQVAVSAQNYYAVCYAGGSAATAAYSASVGGQANTSSNAYSLTTGGQNNTASGQSSAVVGSAGSTASGNWSGVVVGQSNTASGSQSAVVGGSYGTTRSIAGNFVTPASISPITGAAGISQTGLLILARQTTDATATRLTSDTSAAGTTNQVILPINSAYTFQGTCIAAKTTAGDTSSWKFEGAIKRGFSAFSTVLVAAVTPTVIAQDAGASTWVLAITADTTNGGIAVTVTGQAATTIRWVVKIETTEVTF